MAETAKILILKTERNTFPQVRRRQRDARTQQCQLQRAATYAFPTNLLQRHLKTRPESVSFVENRDATLDAISDFQMVPGQPGASRLPSVEPSRCICGTGRAGCTTCLDSLAVSFAARSGTPCTPELEKLYLLDGRNIACQGGGNHNIFFVRRSEYGKK